MRLTTTLAISQDNDPSKKEANIQLATTLMKYGAALYSSINGRFHFVHPSSKGSKWQITVYDSQGVVSDTQHEDLSTMLQTLVDVTPVEANRVETLLQTFASAEMKKSNVAE